MTPLHLACKLGHEAVVATLLNENPKKGGSLDSHPPDLNARTSAGVMPLALAALEGHLGIAERLIKAGAAVDGAGTAKETALHRAVKAGHLPVVEALLKAGAGVNRLDMRRSTWCPREPVATRCVWCWRAQAACRGRRYRGTRAARRARRAAGASRRRLMSTRRTCLRTPRGFSTTSRRWCPCGTTSEAELIK